MRDFTNRVVVVTGAAAGMGKGIAKAFKAEGAQVVITDIEQGALDATAEELGLPAIRTDVSREADLEGLANQVMERFGKVDILCNNAGVCPIVGVAKATIEDWRWTFDVNMWGVVYGMRAFLPHLLANPDGGHIFNNTAGAGMAPTGWIGPYSAAKAAAIALSESLYHELRESGANVGVTIFLPGAVATEIGTSIRNRPADLMNSAVDRGMKPTANLEELKPITGDSVGWLAVDAIRRGALYATTHDYVADRIQERMEMLFADMRHPRPEVEYVQA